MFISPRTYFASQTPDQDLVRAEYTGDTEFNTLQGWRPAGRIRNSPAEMLLIHQAGSVRVGEVVRYTLTYTPAADNIRPPPRKLYVKVKNTTPIPLRAAYLHGPYSLYASCYPSTFDPNVKSVHHNPEAIPQYEPYLKAGGTWYATVTLPHHAQQFQEQSSGAEEMNDGGTSTWIIEIVSQVVFSNTASVSFELLVGRDEASVDLLSTSSISLVGTSKPAQLKDHWSPELRGKQVLAERGVHSRAVTLQVDDTASLWNTPQLPLVGHEKGGEEKDEFVRDAVAADSVASNSPAQTPTVSADEKRQKRIHLVVLTHGLHSNLGADMLFLKESIDAAIKANKQKANNSSSSRSASKPTGLSSSDFRHAGGDQDEQVIVRGFAGNAVRTERGIQYLGKRLAKYILQMAHLDIPSRATKTTSHTGLFSNRKRPAGPVSELPRHCCSKSEQSACEACAYQVTSISFIGHSLGGLVQTYAIAYIHKHFPAFFDEVRPINFVSLATPFLGLSHENPIYVRFALDLGLVGRTGQDLGLSWTAPRVRSGWEALIGGRGNASQSQGYADARSKPLLRILPCGPAHEALSKFQRRTLYSNVVNDGIVPLRTSCLLFLDWRGLDRVEKARRENGLVGTMAEWGWAELTGANSKSPRSRPNAEALAALGDAFSDSKPTSRVEEVSSPGINCTIAERPVVTSISQPAIERPCPTSPDAIADSKGGGTLVEPHLSSTLAKLFSFIRPKETESPSGGPKHTKIYKRSQTIATPNSVAHTCHSSSSHYQTLVGGQNHEYGLFAPPKTTFFESASDLLMPPLPPLEFILDPTSRPRTIFHDRIYHPEDIPPPMVPKRRAFTLAPSQRRPTNHALNSSEDPLHGELGNSSEAQSGLGVEEKIARAYHRDLSWRKVLVRLEPDAHNNIIVRRMFTNAHGWPVVQHLVETHFGHAESSQSGKANSESHHDQDWDEDITPLAGSQTL
ncbi:lipase ROG1 family protein [Aspergillus brunneoviolaceus CBS 621.78]|uniref:Lipase/serine esterase n=1 Tax=Aspergillus brunneoviolaceus CBS 621.78 TaxID=1450534 RepID=A0ACD1G9T0_9EURO|nr:lipase/serine esterase [Aspergillus brunneoviolaceus CBS 621.78]RAH45871.1 lipase/serine esterase [Aspergillus brunneoviolaceus CBS 621.78]